MKLLPHKSKEANGFIATASLAFLSVGSSLLNARSAGKAAKKQRAELRRREAQLEETTTQATGAVEAAGRAAVAPLEREVGILRDTEGFRNPMLEQSMIESVRQQAGQAVERVSTSRNPAAARAKIINALFQSRGLIAQASARADRLSKLQGARTQLLLSAGQSKQQTASTAAGIRMSGAQAIAGLPMPEQAPNTTASLTGGFLSSLGSMSDEEKTNLDEYRLGIFGSEDIEDAEVELPAGLKSLGNFG